MIDDNHLNSDPDAAFAATVRGRVQGVGFRMFVLQRANRLGLVGHVSNQPDRSVYVVARGHRAHLEALLDDLRRGPTGAHVTDVQCEWLVEPHRVEESRFMVRG